MSDENAREALLKRQIIQRFPGISYAWVNAANKEAAEYFGFADKESHTLVDENTVFPACSISKFITALCVMKLHEQKTIDWRAVFRFVSGFPILLKNRTKLCSHMLHKLPVNST